MESRSELQSRKFFYGLLISVSPSEIQEHLNSLTKECEAIEDQIYDICYYMEGGMKFDEAWGLNHTQRDNLIKNLNQKIKRKSGDTREFM